MNYRYSTFNTYQVWFVNNRLSSHIYRLPCNLYRYLSIADYNISLIIILSIVHKLLIIIYFITYHYRLSFIIYRLLVIIYRLSFIIKRYHLRFTFKMYHVSFIIYCLSSITHHFSFIIWDLSFAICKISIFTAFFAHIWLTDTHNSSFIIYRLSFIDIFSSTCFIYRLPSNIYRYLSPIISQIFDIFRYFLFIIILHL